MLIATPFVPGLTDYTLYAADLRKKGLLLNHIHVVVCRPEDEDEAYRFGSGLSDVFLRSVTKVLSPGERNRITLANELFRAAVKFCSAYRPQEGEMPDPAVLYMDPNYRPTKTGWADTLQATYYLKKAPMTMGRWKLDAEDAKIFEGPMILSRNFPKQSGLLDFLPPNVHYRMYLKHELGKAAVETELIGAGSQDAVLKLPPSKK